MVRKGKAVAIDEIRKLTIRTSLLSCKLSDEELLKYGNDLGVVVQDIKTEEDRQTSLKQDLKARLTSLEADRAVLASKITRKEEFRAVEVQPAINFKEGVYREIRIDTGELLFERPVTEDERQEYLKLDDKPAKKKTGEDK